MKGYCPCCGKEKIREYEEHLDMRGGANIMSLNEAKEAYKNGSKVI